jgi:hypothetical protein
MGKKTNDYFIQIVERNTGTPKSPILYDHRTRDESNASIQLYTHIYEANKDGIVILGIGYYRKKEMWVFRKVVSWSGSILEDWKPKSKLAGLTDGMADLSMEYEIPKEDKDIWLIRVRYKRQNYYLIREEAYDLQPDFRLVRKYALENFPPNWHAEVYTHTEGRYHHALFNEYHKNADAYLPPAWRLATYDTVTKKFEADPASKIRIEDHILHPNPGIVTDTANGLWYIFGAYSDKEGSKMVADGTYCIAFDYKTGIVKSSRLYPFEENMSWIKSFQPKLIEKMEDGSYLALCGAESRKDRYGYIVLKLKPDGGLDWIRYACASLRDESIQSTAGVVMTVHNPEDGFQIWAKTTEADVDAKDFKDADKGVKVVLLNIWINPKGERKVQEVVDFGKQKELKPFRPYHIQGYYQKEFMFRFRPKKNRYTYGVMRVR